MSRYNETLSVSNILVKMLDSFNWETSRKNCNFWIILNSKNMDLERWTISRIVSNILMANKLITIVLCDCLLLNEKGITEM